MTLPPPFLSRDHPRTNARSIFDSLDCAVDAMNKGGLSPIKVIDSFVGDMGGRVNDKISNVLATATGFTRAEVQ